jgi:hypothetical protein
MSYSTHTHVALIMGIARTILHPPAISPGNRILCIESALCLRKKRPARLLLTFANRLTPGVSRPSWDQTMSCLTGMFRRIVLICLGQYSRMFQWSETVTQEDL